MRKEGGRLMLDRAERWKGVEEGWDDEENVCVYAGGGG